MHSLKLNFIALITALVTACGGGGSSSGGGMVAPIVDPLPTGKFVGTYRTEAYSGSIEVTINGGSSVSISMNGIPCFPPQFSDGLAASVSGEVLVIGGDIGGLPMANIGTIPAININVPVVGGTGVIDVVPPAPCLGQAEGTITLNR